MRCQGLDGEGPRSLSEDKTTEAKADVDKVRSTDVKPRILRRTLAVAARDPDCRPPREGTTKTTLAMTGETQVVKPVEKPVVKPVGRGRDPGGEAGRQAGRDAGLSQPVETPVAVAEKPAEAIKETSKSSPWPTRPACRGEDEAKVGQLALQEHEYQKAKVHFTRS